MKRLNKADALTALNVTEESVLKGMGLSTLEWEVYAGEVNDTGTISLRVRNRAIGGALEDVAGGAA